MIIAPGCIGLTKRSWRPPPMLVHPSASSRATILRVLVSGFGTGLTVAFGPNRGRLNFVGSFCPRNYQPPIRSGSRGGAQHPDLRQGRVDFVASPGHEWGPRCHLAKPNSSVAPKSGPPLAIPQFGAAVPVDLGLSGLRARNAPSIEPHGPSSSAVPQPRCRTHPQIGTAMASNALSQLMRFTRFCTIRKLSAARRRRWICRPANRRCCSSRYSTIITVELTV